MFDDEFFAFDFGDEFGFGGEVGEVFGGEELFVFAQYGVFGNGGVGFGAEQDADGWVVAFGAFEVIEHPHIHIELPDVLVGDLVGFQLYDYEAFEEVIVKNEINEKIGGFGADVLLASNEGKSLA